MDSYLVTGGAGFIGSNIISRLLESGHAVKCLDDFSTGKHINIKEFLNNPSFSLIEGDLRDVTVVDEAVYGVDYVLHQGALPSVPRSVKDPVSSNAVNINGTLNVLEAAKKHKVKRVVFASSSSVYGNTPKLPKDESLPVNPLSPYALTKYAGERYCQIYYQIYGLETVCLRYFNVFGPGQDPSSQYSAVIPRFVTAVLQDIQPVVFGDGLQSRDFTFVENNIYANLLACKAEKAPGEVFNIAIGERYTLLTLLDTINDITGKKIQPRFEPERAGDVKHSMADIRKAREILNYQPRTGFREGMEKLIASML